MNIELIPFGPPDKEWEFEVAFEGNYQPMRFDILYVRIHSPEGEIMDITEVWVEIIPTLDLALTKRIFFNTTDK
jgi:allantoicase